MATPAPRPRRPDDTSATLTVHDGAVVVPASGLGPVPPAVGPYVLGRELGRGGMGAVFEARDTRLDRAVALKLVAAGGDAAHRDMVQRFHREAQAAGRLAGHPHVVGVHDVGEAAGFLWLAMDLVHGISLDAFTEGGDEPLDTVVALVEQACRGVHHAHQHGVLHRDLKPGNVLVEGAAGKPETLRARVVDFGLARTHGGPEVARLTQSGTVLGTPAFMPPEQAQGEGCEPRSDVYALGATLYHALTGAPPFEAETVGALLLRVVEGDVAPPRAKNPAVPRDLDAIVRQAMAREPAHRYPTAAAMADDLARFRRGEPVRARPGRGARAVWRMARHHPVAATLALLALAAAATAPWALRTAAGRRDAVTRAAAETGAAERAARISQAYWRLALATRAELALLEDRRHGAAVPPAQVAAALARVRAVAAEVAGPDVGVGEAWVALAEVGAGEADAARARLARARQAAPQDPFAPLIAARLDFAAWVEHLAAPELVYGIQSVEVTPVAESADARARRAAAARALEDALGPARWQGVDQGLEHRRFGEAAARLAGGDPDGAATALRPLVDDPLLGGDARALLATALTERRRFDEALAALEPLVARGWLDSANFAVSVLLATATAREAAGEPTEAPLDRAVALCDGLLAGADPRTGALQGRVLARVLRSRAQRARGADPRGDLAAARADADRLVASRPDVAAVWHLRAVIGLDAAMAEALAGRDPSPACAQALDDIEAALARVPDRPDWRRVRADVRFQLGQAAQQAGADERAHYAAARADLEAAVQAAPDDGSLWFTLGNVARAIAIARGQRGEDPFADLDAAIAAYDRATVTVASALPLTGRGAAWALRAEFEDRAGRDPEASFARAIADFDAALAKNPGHAPAWGNRGNAWGARALAAARRGGDARPGLANAVADYSRALALHAGHPGFLHNRAVAHLQVARHRFERDEDPTRDAEAAVADCDAAVAVAADRPPYYWTRASAHRVLAAWRGNQGDDPAAALRAALEDLRRIRVWWEERAELHGELGMVLASLGQWDEALAACQRAVELRPQDEALRRQLAMVRARAGR